MPRLQQLAEAYAKRDVVMLALNTGDPVERIRGYWEKEKFTIRVLREKEREISGAYGVEAYPTNYVIGPDRKVAARTVAYNERALKEALDKLAPK